MLAYAATIFVGAFLLFLAQPLIGKYILPWFGGAPGVWTTCLLFFQVMLLAGYAYAYLSSRWLKPRGQVVCHLFLAGLALALMPITPGDSWEPDGAGNPIVQILCILAASLGLPYFVLAATGPLLQHWFSRTHPHASPYRLYALSNAASLLALIGFPVYFEPRFSRHAQAVLWGCGLVVYTIGSCFCAIKVWRAKNPEPVASTPGKQECKNEHRSGQAREDAGSSILDRVLWLLLPACASMMLLATTNRMCQEVAVIPFLWVLPLSLYLLSFIICFDSPRWYVRPLFIPALSVLWVAWLFFAKAEAAVSVQLALYATGLFICCMVCHGELCRLKPDPRQLTLFYLFIAAGGALGGLFVAVVAPLIFHDYFEMQTGMMLAGVLLILIVRRDWNRKEMRRWRLAFAVWTLLSFGALFMAVVYKIGSSESSASQKTRNFYGVLTVGPGQDGVLMLRHGATMHGTQFTDPQRAGWPTLYYGEKSGVGVAMQAIQGEGRSIGMIGLGIGTLAAYGKSGDHFYIYEINPEVLRLAASRFSYLSNCAGILETFPGDARLSLERSPARNFDLLVIDAFNSDAIPVHLLTREAFEIYRRHMKTNGVVAIHITNRSLNLEPVILNLAREFNCKVAIISQGPPPGKWWIVDNSWMLLSHDAELMDSRMIRIARRPARRDLPKVALWTDDFVSLYPILRRKPLESDDAFEEAQFQMARSRGERGDFPGAAEVFQTALKTAPDSPFLHNNLAFLLATCPDVQVRNAAGAVAHGERACELTDYKQPLAVSTLAIAYASAGRMDEAISTAEKACAMAEESGIQELLSKNRELLELFRERQRVLK